MIPSYRDPDVILKETRQMVAEQKALKKIKRANMFVKLRELLVASLVIGAGVFMLGLAILTVRHAVLQTEEMERNKVIAAEKKKADRLSGDCSLFASEKMADIPVRCIRYYQDGK